MLLFSKKPRATNAAQIGQSISIRNASLFYGDRTALQNISMEIPARKITALIGPSGCGKSSLLKCLNRMNDLTEGCRVEGEFLLGKSDIYTDIDLNELRKKVGMVFQKPNPFPMSVFDNVAYGPRSQGIRQSDQLEKIVEQSLRRAAMWDELQNRLHSSALALSGGQQQRLCIARALAVKPQILLMDEPTSALDPISTAKIEELCCELRKTTTLVIVTHNMQQARRLSDVTAFLLSGHLVEMDTTETLFNHPKREETARYVKGQFG